ncbi:MAG: tRNA (adenine(22)-N(1))-methyltransferase TrmK [Proteobacteria bacterium]|nr:tRNA (adenine(22)-N(1))-methyltransferase TrmK [Pseudomonadota bacterium]
MMRSKEADAFIKEIQSRKTPYEKEVCGIQLRIDQHVFPTGEVGELFYEALMNPIHGIKPNETVLDYGTGAGYLAIQAAKLGAQVIAIDISSKALACANYNITKNNVSEKIQTRQGNAFESIKPGEKFDLILAGIPWEDAKPQSALEMAFYDENFEMRKALFKSAKNRLTKQGRILSSYSKRVQESHPIESFLEGYDYFIISEKNIRGEPHYIYCIQPKKNLW